MATWRPGKHGGVQVDTDPYSGATLAEPVMANQGDLDEAYHAAAKAQISWAARLPAEGAAVMLCSASIMEARHGFRTLSSESALELDSRAPSRLSWAMGLTNLWRCLPVSENDWQRQALAQTGKDAFGIAPR